MPSEHYPVPLLLRSFSLAGMASVYATSCLEAEREGWSPCHLLRHRYGRGVPAMQIRGEWRLFKELCAWGQPYAPGRLGD